MKISISILGSTGSIGETTLRIIRKKKFNFDVHVLAAKSNYLKICSQINEFEPKVFVVINKKIFSKIKKKFKNKKTKIYNNYDFLEKIKKKIDITVSAIPGITGLEPTINFTKISKKILLANKESIICGWNIIKRISKKNKTTIVPLDSEHFSIQKIIENHKANEINKIYLTASGGPFLKMPLSKFKSIKPKDAIKHPKWKMGNKISVDSATLMNKILELIEAQKIFPEHHNKIKIIIHPQSLVHAIVKFNNGITKLLYHEPDMIIPISNAIFNSNNLNTFAKLNNKIKNLEFYDVDKKRFPIVKIIPIVNQYISTPIIINAANEILVDQFMKQKISFSSIFKHLYQVLKDQNYKKYAIQEPKSLNNIYAVDSWAREITFKKIKKKIK